jgi:tripartite-type tricarboxylate transporter receptor subunit TctC
MKGEPAETGEAAKHRSWRAVTLVATAFACGSALAQSYPSRPIRLIVPFTAGGGTDISARIVGQRLGERLGTSIVIDNRTGAGGMVGTEIVARASPDGYSLVLVSSSHAINPSLHRTLPYDAVKDFAPVTLVVLSPGILVVNPAIPARSVKEFIDLVRSKPGQLTYASAGNGTPVHLSMELLKSVAGIDIVHVPYKGSAAVMTDILSGRIAAMIPSVASVLPLVKAGKLNALAVTSRTRTAAAPDVPTMIEAGVPGYDAASWYGLLAPAATPRAIVNRLNAETVRVLRMDDVRERLIGQGLDPVGNSAQEFAARIGEEIAKWRGVVKAAGVKLE